MTRKVRRVAVIELRYRDTHIEQFAIDRGVRIIWIEDGGNTFTSPELNRDGTPAGDAAVREMEASK